MRTKEEIKKVPEVEGVSLKEAKEILEKANIEIEKEKKKFNIFEKSGKVIKVEPKEKTKLKKNEKVVLYVNDRRPILVIILLFLLCALFMMFRSGTISTLISTTAPVIKSKTHEWVKTGMVVVTKDAKMIDELKTYEYCVTNIKNTIGCNWQTTDTKNASIGVSGKWYVYFRGIDVRGRKSKASNREYVNVDNISPVVEKIKTSVGITSIKVTVEANDTLSGLNNYFYKIDDKDYVMGEKTYTFKNLEANKEYEITIKVVDKVGNETIVTRKVTTSTKKEDNSVDNNTPGEPNEPTTPDEPSTPDEPTTPDEPSTPDEPEEIIEPPYIDLNEVPSVLEYKEDHKLPSRYDFKNSTGTVSCKVGNDEYTNTADLPVGNHTIVCTATNKEGMSTTVSKDVEVKIFDVEETEEDGWIWLNLHYPANSTKWEWKKLEENEELDGDDLNWHEYTGPIRVRIEDIDKIVIRYELDGNEIIISPDGYYVDIEPEKTSVKSGDVTKVKINYSKNFEKVEYRINNGVWQDYIEEFEVGANTSIEARIRYLIDVYDDDGNLLLQKTKKKTAIGYIGEIIDPTSNPSTPSTPSKCTTCSCVSGSFNVNIVSTSGYINNNMPVKIRIDYETGATIKQYKIGSGSWQNYTGEFTVSRSTIVYARASGYKEINGCTKWVSGSDAVDLNSRWYGLRIDPDKTSVDSSETTRVVIDTWQDSSRLSLEYSINGGDFVSYTKPFSVGANTYIVARATWVLDNGEQISRQTSKTIYENTNGLRVSVEPSVGETSGLDKSYIRINTNYKAEKIEYTLDNGASWTDYTGVFGVSAKSNVCARATKTNTDGTSQTSPIVCRYIREDDLGLRINPSAYGARQGKYVTASISTDYSVEKIEYSLDNGATWSVYGKGRIAVKAGDDLLARATYNGVIVSTSLRIDILPEPAEILAGPTISANPDTTLSKSVDITITTKDLARDIYYSIDNGKYQLYTGVINVVKNSRIDAYYVRDSDGKISKTSTYYVQNIHVGNKPYVRIDTDPKNYLINGTQDKVDVTISGQNYNTLEYSFDGINYQSYTGVIEVTTSVTIYARATNDVGSTVTSFTVVTKNPPKVWKNLSVSIIASPDTKDLIDSDGKVKLVNETEVSLVYGSDVTSACYKEVGAGNTNLASIPCTPYTKAFKIKQNETIYAYVQSADGNGSSVKMIDFLTLGIASPIITEDTTTITSSTHITIDYDKNAIVKKYRIDKGAWLDYNGPFEVTANCEIEAMNEDMLGNQASSNLVISNVIKPIQYNALDKGDYYLIKLNYPANAVQSTREYKWKSDGVWKTYDDHGILLIKPSAASKIVTANGVKITDDAGNEIIITDHYYILDVDIDKLGENLYMRWDMQKVEAPKIIVSEEEETVTSVDVAVNYNKALVSKLYRVIYDDGRDTGWIDYTKKFKVDGKGIVYAKGIDIDGRDSEIAEQRIDNIDSTGPVITITGDLVTPKQKVTLLISATDDGEVDSLLYEVGSKKADYFKKNGIGLKNPSTITINENGKYTFYAVDALGNETIQEIEITNIDKTAPDIEIKVLSTTVGTSTEVEINYDDSITMQYKVGETGTYQNYTGKFILSSYDLFDLRNQDGSLTIYAKGKDQAGNESTVKEITYVLDLNPFATPVINVSDGYPMLTSTGMIQGKPSYITYDPNTTDVTNYYSIDNGVTWKEYTGGVPLVSGEIQAKSVRESTGLEFATSANVVVPTNAIGTDTYDKNLQTSENLAKSANKIFTVSPDIYGKEIKIYTGNNVSSTSTIKLYDKNKTLLNTIETKDVLTIVEVLNDTYYVEINSGSSTLEVREIELRGEREIFEEYTPIISINEGGWASEKIATIKYYNDEYTNEYSLDNGATWNTYVGPIKLIEPTNVMARTTRDDKVLGSSNFIVTKVDPEEPVIELNIANKIQLGYDQEIPTYYKQTLSGTTVECKDGDTVVTNIKELTVGDHKIICTAKTGAGKKATVEKNVKIIDMTDFVADSLLDAISNEDFISGRYKIQVNEESYPVHVITLDGNQHFTENQTFGDAADVATATDYAQNMVIVKVNGDLTIDEGVTVAPYYDAKYGGPKGFTLYVTGKLTNNGTIDNSHGAKAEGQNVYLWKNTDGTYEYVPAEGAAGGNSRTSMKLSGNAGKDGVNRQTGGGGSGGAYNANSGFGSAGTSYSGGSGGGPGHFSYGTNASSNGAAGGNGSGSGGAGNPGGIANSSDGINGENGTGGLLTIYANEYDNRGILSTKGYKGGNHSYNPCGGSSGGGSINIFTNQSTGIDQLGIITNTRYEEIKGDTSDIGGSSVGSDYKGGSGGKGTTNIGEIRNGQYYDLKDIIEQDKEKYIESVTIKGDSILNILNDNNLKTGYYYFVANEESYPVHVITLDGNQHFTENQTFGDAADVATATDYAQNMVIVKVNGDLTIDEGVTVAPYYDAKYGGPKGFTLYVTGKLTNNGTIDNSHGAKAEGQNVYLWKNTDGTYEYVPAEGAAGGNSRTSMKLSGNAGKDGVNRQTGGGGSGGAYNANSGFGSAGTSYSGGSGGGPGHFSYGTNASSNGAAGGNGSGSGGAGNPGGIANSSDGINGENGTGGLLTIYANEYDNRGILSTKGYKGGNHSYNPCGGSSGGGSINIFYINKLSDGTINVNGGSSVGSDLKGGAGGKGTVSYTQLSPVSFTLSHTYANLTESKFEKETNIVTINYSSILKDKLYSLDDGNTWLDYKKPFAVNLNDKILAKATNKDGSETEVITYIVPETDGIPYNAYDGTTSEKATLEANKEYVFTIDEKLKNRKIRFYLENEASSDASIKVYDKNNTELLSTTFVNNLTVINLPEGSYKFVITGGSENLEISEINLKERIEVNKNIPEIKINDTNWTSSKTIEISYSEGYKNEYSLDLGENWIEYEEPIIIEEEKIILARSLEDDKVVGSSSYLITSVDNVEPTIEMNIPDEVTQNDSYEIPTKSTFGKSEGTVICKANEKEVKNTNELEEGENTITCTATSGSGKTTEISKTITLVKVSSLKDTIMSREIITTEPTLTTSSNNTEDASGLYKSTATNSGEPTYYFRGDVQDNYVSFAGQTWRIVRINEDGTIRLIMQDGINNNQAYAFNSKYDDYSYMYYSNSEAKTALENWYNTNIENNETYSKQVATGAYFCEQAKVKYNSNYTSGAATMTVYTSYTPNFKCETDGNGKGIVNSNIGLITYDEAVYAGGYFLQSNNNYYLYTTPSLSWTMSPSGVYDYISNVGDIAIYFSGDIGDHYISYDHDSTGKYPNILRPVINLKSDAQISGLGTIDDPYVVK